VVVEEGGREGGGTMRQEQAEARPRVFDQVHLQQLVSNVTRHTSHVTRHTSHRNSVAALSLQPHADVLLCVPATQRDDGAKHCIYVGM
jgi:hypothetical protein